MSSKSVYEGRCQARAGRDGVECQRCGFQWDADDKDPPTCLTTQQVGIATCKRLKAAL